MNDAPLTVEITDAHQDAVKISAADLRPTDLVFDVFGGRHAIQSLRHGKRTVSFVREDQPETRDRFLNDDTITVIRPA